MSIIRGSMKTASVTEKLKSLSLVWACKEEG